jgi:hypothetical protein
MKHPLCGTVMSRELKKIKVRFGILKYEDILFKIHVLLKLLSIRSVRFHLL